MRKIILVLAVSVLCFSACRAGGEGSTRQSTQPPPPLKPETDFAREAIVLLVKGDPRVEEMIDWETFKTFGDDVGSKYWYIPGENGKAAFRKSFIGGYSAAFRERGETMEGLSNWRVQSKEESRTVVAADYSPSMTLVFTISLKDGRQKLSEISKKQ
jgi:hypothetical protein